MPTTLETPKVKAILDRLFTKSDEQIAGWRSGAAPFPEVAETASLKDQVEAYAEILIPVTPATGNLLYSLVRATRPATVVEYGMSFGVSTLHLAAAVRDNGTGRVVTTELSSHKIAAARASFAEAGLSDVITVLEGDARETLAGLDGPVDFLLLDGWPKLAPDVLAVVEPKLAVGALVVADNTALPGVEPYLAHVRNPANGYASSNFVVRGEDGIEISCRVG